jgi:hypothetical protein
MEHDTGKTGEGIGMKIIAIGKTDYNLNFFLLVHLNRKKFICLKDHRTDFLIFINFKNL